MVLLEGPEDAEVGTYFAFRPQLWGIEYALRNFGESHSQFLVWGRVSTIEKPAERQHLSQTEQYLFRVRFLSDTSHEWHEWKDVVDTSVIDPKLLENQPTRSPQATTIPAASLHVSSKGRVSVPTRKVSELEDDEEPDSTRIGLCLDRL